MSRKTSSENDGEAPQAGEGSPNLPLHKGFWTEEEEQYVDALITEFKAGRLPLVEGTTLRSFLANMLHCHPKRISKKFRGTNYNGKQAYIRRTITMTPAEAQARREELQELERKFKAVSTSKPPPPPSTTNVAAPAAASAQLQDPFFPRSLLPQIREVPPEPSADRLNRLLVENAASQGVLRRLQLVQGIGSDVASSAGDTERSDLPSAASVPAISSSPGPGPSRATADLEQLSRAYSTSLERRTLQDYQLSNAAAETELLRRIRAAGTMPSQAGNPLLRDLGGLDASRFNLSALQSARGLGSFALTPADMSSSRNLLLDSLLRPGLNLDQRLAATDLLSGIDPYPGARPGNLYAGLGNSLLDDLDLQRVGSLLRARQTSGGLQVGGFSLPSARLDSASGNLARSESLTQPSQTFQPLASTALQTLMQQQRDLNEVLSSEEKVSGTSGEEMKARRQSSSDSSSDYDERGILRRKKRRRAS